MLVIQYSKFLTVQNRKSLIVRQQWRTTQGQWFSATCQGGTALLSTRTAHPRVAARSQEYLHVVIKVNVVEFFLQVCQLLQVHLIAENPCWESSVSTPPSTIITYTKCTYYLPMKLFSSTSCPSGCYYLFYWCSIMTDSHL